MYRAETGGLGEDLKNTQGDLDSLEESRDRHMGSEFSSDILALVYHGEFPD